MTDTRALMATLGQTTVVEILGPYEALLDERHDLEIEALGSRWPTPENYQARRDVNRRLHLYEQLAAEAERLIGVQP